MNISKQIVLCLAIAATLVTDAQENAFARGFSSAKQAPMISLFAESQMTPLELTEPRKIEGNPFVFKNYMLA